MLGRAVQRQHRLECGEGQLADAQRPPERIAAESLDQVSSPDEQSRLRPAEKLVATECDEIRARGDGVMNGGLGRQLPAPQVDESAAAQIDGDRNAVGAAELHELL